MDVYLLPVAADRYLLYCEAAAVPAPLDASPGFKARVVRLFHRLVAEGEEAQYGTQTPDRDRPGRIRRAATRWLVQTIADQRVLWHLRRRASARLLHPDDLSGAAAGAIARGILESDRRRHWRWFAIDGLLSLLSLPVALVPGPNVLGYYFLFRTVGHCFSITGATSGLTRVAWVHESSPPLSALRATVGLDLDARGVQVGVIGAALGLSRLVPFMDTAVGRAS